MNTPHARHSDPVGSHLTVASLAKDEPLKLSVLNATRAIYAATGALVTDDDVLDYLEAHHSRRRWQRSVIARTRGLLEQDGEIERFGSVTGRTGRPTVAYAPTNLPRSLF